jgi:hypothetical protein
MPPLSADTEKAMSSQSAEWRITCDRNVFEKCRRDPKFPFIVALARSVNALNSSHSLILRSFKVETPGIVRNRMNSYFFSSALLYEGIRLIRKMNRVFADDVSFQTGLRMLLKDPMAQKIEQGHLSPARNHAVFHFIPEEFKQAIRKESPPSCVFLGARGKKRMALHYSYADVVAAEMLVGFPADQQQFWPALQSASEETGSLLLRFADAAEELIGNYLKNWGFLRE